MNNYILKFILYSFICTLFSFCHIESDYFGYSDKGELTQLEVKDQNGVTVLSSKDRTAQIFVSDSADMSSITITKIATSSLSTCDKKIGDQLDLSNGVDSIWIQSEDLSKVAWRVYMDLTQTASVKEIQFEGQSTNSKIVDTNISAVMPPNADLSNTKITKLILSNGATASIKEGDCIDLTKEFSFKVENKANDVEVEYTIVASIDLAYFVHLTINNQIGETQYISNQNNRIIEVIASEEDDMSKITVQDAELKNGFKEVDTHYLEKGAILNFTSNTEGPIIPVVIDENGEQHTWEIRAFQAKQFPDYEFTHWYQDEIRGLTPKMNQYTDLGNSEGDFFWTTTNRGAALEAEGKETVTPLNENKGVHIHTDLVTTLGMFQISTGFVFTGAFERDRDKIFTSAMAGTVASLAYLYTDFCIKPKGVQIKYRYKSGKEYYKGKKSRGNDYGDCAEIGLAIERWEGDHHKRIATFWTQPSHDPNFEWHEIKEDFVYGSFDINQNFIYPGTPYVPIEFGDPDIDIPNKFLIVLKSSAKADDVKGAEGSVLDVEYVRLVY